MYRADGVGDDLDGEIGHGPVGNSDSSRNSNGVECYPAGLLVFIVDNVDLSAI